MTEHGELGETARTFTMIQEWALRMMGRSDGCQCEVGCFCLCEAVLGIERRTDDVEGEDRQYRA